MIDLNTNPGPLVLIGLFTAFVILGFATLSGTVALLIWVIALVIVFLLAYAILSRVAQWARGERPLLGRRGGDA
jgi:NADH dehydrogenase FAD-containing subunit